MPEYSVKLLGKAEDDLDEICEYLSRFYPGTVGRFLEVLEESFDHPPIIPGCISPMNGTGNTAGLSPETIWCFTR
jgi:hypothetical protein